MANATKIIRITYTENGVSKEFSRKCVATRNGNTNDTLLMQTKALALEKTPGISNVEVTEEFID